MKQEMFIYLAWKPWYQYKHIREIEGQQKDNKLQRHFTSPYKKCRWSCARKNSFWQDVYGFCVSFPNLWTKTLWIRKSLAATSTMNAAGFPYVFMTKTFMSNVRTFPEDCLAIPPKKAENVFWCAAYVQLSLSRASTQNTKTWWFQKKDCTQNIKIEPPNQHSLQ